MTHLEHLLDWSLSVPTISLRFIVIASFNLVIIDVKSKNVRLTSTFNAIFVAILFKLNKGIAPDTAQMNAKVREMIKEALQSEGVEEIFKLGEEAESEQDIFDEDYLAKIDKIKLPNTKIKILQRLLAQAIDEFKKVNKIKGVDFSERLKRVVDDYNNRRKDEAKLFRGE